jgi:hypothetical protein
VTVRVGPKTTRQRFTDLTPALNAAEARARELAESAPGRVVDVRYKRFDPAEQVVARIELAGPQRLFPSVKGGLDVHGDGSTEAFTGRVRRRVVETRRRETPAAALRRVLGRL